MRKKSLRRVFLILGAVMSAVLFSMVGWNSRSAVQVILGEAADQSFLGKLAVAEVIRNRGGTDGFSSTKKDLKVFYSEQPPSVQRSAWIAWILSRYTYVTFGADHFDNVVQFGVPDWAKNMKKTVRIQGTQFYKS